MKKLVAYCLTLALCLGSVITAPAAEYGPYTFKENIENGATVSFDAADLTTETLKFKDPESDNIYEEELTVLNLKPGSSVNITDRFGANNYVLVDGAYEMGSSWTEFSSGPVEAMFKGAPYLFYVWDLDQPIYFKMGENTPEGSTYTFSDVAPGAYYAKAVTWAVERGSPQVHLLPLSPLI